MQKRPGKIEKVQNEMKITEERRKKPKDNEMQKEQEKFSNSLHHPFVSGRKVFVLKLALCLYLHVGEVTESLTQILHCRRGLSESEINFLKEV